MAVPRGVLAVTTANKGGVCGWPRRRGQCFTRRDAQGDPALVKWPIRSPEAQRPPAADDLRFCNTHIGLRLDPVLIHPVMRDWRSDSTETLRF